MKHLFTIHSPLTFLVAFAVIEHLKLDRKDVILLSQGYQVPVAGFQVEPAFQDKYSKWYQKLQTLNFPKSYDRYIDQLTEGQAFTTYVDLMAYYQKVLVTHPQCQAFHFLEEGNSAYQATDDLTDLTWADRHYGYRNRHFLDGPFLKALVRVLRGYNLRVLSIPYHYLAYAAFPDLKYYCFSNNAFFNAPPEKKILVRPDPAAPEVQQMAAGIRLEKEIIWIDGSNGRYTGLSEDYYYRAIDRAILQLEKEKLLQKKVYVKLRPGVVDLQSNYLVKVLSDHGPQVEVLPDNVVLESLFITSSNCLVLGVLSAALEYAYVFGHQAYSIYGLFEKRPPTFFDRMTGFWQNIRMLGSN